MNILEDIQSFEAAFEGFNKGRLVLAVVEQALQSVELWSVVVAQDLIVPPVLVPEVASASVVADFLLVEGSTILGSELVIWAVARRSKFLLSMGELALLAVAAETVLHPVLA